MKQLLIGCGHSRVKRLGWPMPKWDREWDDLYTLDFNVDVAPDILCNLNSIWHTESSGKRWRAESDRKECVERDIDGVEFLRDDFFDEVHAYEVLEHLGRQGDFVSFFDTFSNLYRILVDGGLVIATVPSRFSGWLWGDPGHTRAILPEHLSFLDQTVYAKECGKTTRSDYRFIWKCDFETLVSHDDKATHAFILKAHKPARE